MRLPFLDFLRFFAAFSVMVMHIMVRGFPKDTYYAHSFGVWGDWLKYNYLAVNLFFIISGFVIFLTAQNRSVKQFCISRFLRLYPAYWLACTISFVVSYFYLQHIFHPTIIRYIANMTMLNGFFKIQFIDNVYWTLFVELKFYLLTLLVIYFKQLQNAEKILWIWLLLSLANYFIHNQIIQNIFITDYSSFFSSGAMLFIISNDNFKLNLKRVAFLILSFFLGFLNESTTLSFKTIQYGFEFSSLKLLLVLFAIYVCFIIAINYKISKHDSSKIFKVCQILGAVSYPLYLIHFNVSLAALNLFASDGSNRYFVAWCLIIFLPCVAYLIAKYFEEPLRNKLNKFFFIKHLS
ncbi:acyltransferase [Methylophilus sp. Leaf408]|uniref:acyltransferase family protein n=1 Tax=Methylophilus sp. Leaf408 TaxID=2876561 RepID=UPI001E476B76|nr:acyltransferase [Methylophilus sp. Leaf408]